MHILMKNHLLDIKSPQLSVKRVLIKENFNFYNINKDKIRMIKGEKNNSQE